LFAYGTYHDYASSKGSYITLTAKMEKKLRILSLASLGLQKSIVTYKEIANFTGLPEDINSVEDILLATVQA